MSFVQELYEDDEGYIRPVRLSVADGLAAGTPPTGAENLLDHAKVTNRNRAFGCRPRYLSLENSSPAGTVRKKLVQLTPADYAAQTLGKIINIGQVAWTVIGKVAELNK